MNCTKCGKEIPEGENKICEDCQKKLVSEIAETEKQEKKTEEKPKKEKKEKKEKAEKVDKKDKKDAESNTDAKKMPNKKMIYIIVGVVIAVCVLIALSFIFVFGNNQVGNTIGNIRNYGYATVQKGWIYYLSPSEDSSQIGIYKVRVGDKDAKSKQELLMENWDILSLNVSKNYVYFIAISSEAASEQDSVDNKIYRMKTDGSDLQVINDNEFNNDCYEIYVIGNSIYYIGTDTNIYKMNLDGSNRELVLDNQTGYLGITDQYIVYNVEKEDKSDYVTYIMNIDGTNARPILENTRLYSINIVGDYIYYTNDAKQICQVKVDGTEQKTLYETTAYNMNVSGKYIYYLNYVDEANQDYTVCIYRVKTDGSTQNPETIKALDTYTSFIDIIDKWIIYMDTNETEGFINLVKVDGSELINLYSLSYESITDETDEPVEETTTTQTNTTTENTVQ